MSISAVSQHSATTTSSFSKVNDSEGRVINLRNFLFLVPAISAIAIGSIFIPHFAFGLGVGAIKLVATIISHVILDRSGILPRVEEKNSKYSEAIRSALLSVSIFGPIVEEGVFRGFLQPVLTNAVQILIPAAAAALFGPTLSVAVIVSVVATSVLFGAAHLFNSHKNAHIQAISSTVAGLIYGFLTVQFGIGAAMAAHIANNTIASCFISLVPEHKKVNSSALPA